MFKYRNRCDCFDVRHPSPLEPRLRKQSSSSPQQKCSGWCGGEAATSSTTAKIRNRNTNRDSAQHASAGDAERRERSYAIGANFAWDSNSEPIQVDPAIVAQGVKDALTGGKLAMTNEEAGAVLKELQADLQKKQETMMSQMSDTNKQEGAAFLAANKAKEGVVTTASGLSTKWKS